MVDGELAVFGISSNTLTMRAPWAVASCVCNISFRGDPAESKGIPSTIFGMMFSQK
jgi:hypothetical protein